MEPIHEALQCPQLADKRYSQFTLMTTAVLGSILTSPGPITKEAMPVRTERCRLLPHLLRIRNCNHPPRMMVRTLLI